MPTVVVGVDGSSGSVAALRWAAAEARLREADLTAVLTYLRPVAYAGTSTSRPDLEPEHRDATQALEEVLDAAGGDLAGLSVRPVVRTGQAARRLIEAASSADLLVIGTHGAGGFAGLLLGATAEHCERHAPCPVVLVPEDWTTQAGRLAVGVDGSEPSRAALTWALVEAGLRGAAVDAVAVYEPYRARGPFGAEFMDVASPGWRARFRRAAEDAVAEAVAGLQSPADRPLEVHVEAGHPARVLADWSRRVDLLVVGHRGVGGFEGLRLGSVARQVLHHTVCPVAVVRPDHAHDQPR